MLYHLTDYGDFLKILDAEALLSPDDQTKSIICKFFGRTEEEVDRIISEIRRKRSYEENYRQGNTFLTTIDSFQSFAGHSFVGIMMGTCVRLGFEGEDRYLAEIALPRVPLEHLVEVHCSPGIMEDVRRQLQTRGKYSYVKVYEISDSS